ncbi:hypothetical protein [Sulfitobacter aestuariivivens]|uniref:Uncharacterized protein n=1 Tax=Sulfitobacter aestuariivivens TaxID=2766981 RepID=A0A927D2L4_9RHOB|nr:hypothetical protein [Sulfitobacter aestuariivivens]MBD3663246.1 hypothetical protein [Sulfitobacter aestuariivivens]
MKKFNDKNAVIPLEIVTLFGTVAVSRIAAMKTKAVLDQMPDVRKALDQLPKERGQTKSLGRFDVENGGMEDEFEEFMTHGFETLIPDFRNPPTKFPVPEIPENVLLCARVLRALRDAVEEQRIQREAVEDLQSLVDGLGSSAHPLIQIFVALFKAGLSEAQARLDELNDLIAGLIRTANNNDCEIPATF